jgi:hypothetical protein
MTDIVAAAGAAASSPLIAKALELVGADVPSVTSLMAMAVKLAQEANKLPNLHGRERQAMVLGAIREVLRTPAVQEKVGGAEAVTSLLAAVDTILPETLTLVVNASRGAFQLQKPSAGCVMGLAAMFCRATGHGQVANTVSALAKAAEPEKTVEVVEIEVVGVAEETPAAGGTGADPTPSPAEAEPKPVTPPASSAPAS